MNSISKIKSEKGDWLLVAPVSGLSLKKAIGEEISIHKVTFVSRKRLPFVRRRLGFPTTIKDLRRKEWTHNFFDTSSVYAVSRLGGTRHDKEKEFLEAARNELSILSLSQLGFGQRRTNACLSISNEVRPGKLEYFMMNTLNKTFTMQFKMSGRFQTLSLDENWKRFQKFGFFYELIDIFKGNKNISSGWRNDITNAALLAGQSQSSSDLPHAFLWNMIAIETLLTHQGDSYSDALPKRVEAFIGWTTDWSVENFENKIGEVYKKRSALVHAGKSHDLQIEDLLFTDIILVNIFYNILKHIKLFPNKNALIEFSKKVEAENTLGMKPRIRPKTISYISLQYSGKDYESI